MTTFTDIEKANIKEFFSACDEMISGKFILSDIKIAKILKCVASSEVLYNLFAQCLINFNFKAEFNKAKVENKVNGGYFVVPEDEKKIVSLVFCLLLEVDNKRINLQNFVNDNFFSGDGYNVAYSNFSINVLVPFKNSVKNLLRCDDEGNFIASTDPNAIPCGQVEMELPTPKKPDTNTKLLFANLIRTLNEMYSAVLNDSKMNGELKDETVIIIKAMREAIKLENLKIINGLIIPLEHTLSKNRHLKGSYAEFKECLITYYYK